MVTYDIYIYIYQSNTNLLSMAVLSVKNIILMAMLHIIFDMLFQIMNLFINPANLGFLIESSDVYGWHSLLLLIIIIIL